MSSSRSTRPILIATAVFLVLTGVFLILRPPNRSQPQPPRPTAASSTTTPAPTASTTWSPSTPSPAPDVHLSWAYIESIDGAVRQGGAQDLRLIDDLVVPALVQDYLDRGQFTRSQPPSAEVAGRLRGALSGSAADVDWLDEQNGGRTDAMRRIIDSCALTDAKLQPVRMAALELARLGGCLREGAIVEPEWTGWVLDEMRSTTGGIGRVRGSDTTQRIAQRNSVVRDGDRYRAGCLAVGAFWSAAILLDYPADAGRDYALAVCAQTARQAFPPDMQQVPEILSPAPATVGA